MRENPQPVEILYSLKVGGVRIQVNCKVYKLVRGWAVRGWAVSQEWAHRCQRNLSSVCLLQILTRTLGGRRKKLWLLGLLGLGETIPCVCYRD